MSKRAHWLKNVMKIPNLQSFITPSCQNKTLCEIKVVVRSQQKSSKASSITVLVCPVKHVGIYITMHQFLQWSTSKRFINDSNRRIASPEKHKVGIYRRTCERFTLFAVAIYHLQAEKHMHCGHFVLFRLAIQNKLYEFKFKTLKHCSPVRQVIIQ